MVGNGASTVARPGPIQRPAIILDCNAVHTVKRRVSPFARV